MEAFKAVKNQKPQGFEVAKERKRGIYYCFYDCGAKFYDKKLAENHPGCSGRSKNTSEIKQTYELAGQEVPEEYMGRTVKFWEKPGILSVVERKSLRREMEDYDGVRHNSTVQPKYKLSSISQETETEWFLKRWLSQIN